MTNSELAADRAICEAATEGPWRAMRDGNQYLGAKYLPTAKCVGTSRIEELPRPWNPHAVIRFMKLDAAEVSRFLDADADFIAAARTRWPAALDCIEAQGRQLQDLIGDVVSSADRDKPVKVKLYSDGKRKYDGCGNCEQNCSGWYKFCPACGSQLEWS